MRPAASPSSTSLVGALWAVLAVVCFSTNDTLVKFLAGDYPLYQIMFLRTLVALAVLFAVLLPLTRGTIRTRRPGVHMLRGLCVFAANFFFFLGLAALPLAEATAIFFVSPFLISAFSVIFLGEVVGPRRWAAIAVGMVGVLVVLRPGTEAFQFAALLPAVAAVGYALLHTLTRHLGSTEDATSMAFYIQLTFLLVSATAGILFGDGHLNRYDHPSAVFLLRGWIWPDPRDLWLIVVLGVTSAMGGFSISQAFRRSEAALIAPFEYIAMPLAVFWGIALFGEWPDLTAILGICLIIASGLVLIWREAVSRRRALDADAAV